MYALVRDTVDPNRLVFGELMPVGDGLRYFRKFPSLDDIVEHLNLTFAISTPAGICKGQAVRVGFLNYSAFSIDRQLEDGAIDIGFDCIFV